VTINNLLPGIINTDRMQDILEARAGAANMSAKQFAEKFFSTIPAKRPGDLRIFMQPASSLHYRTKPIDRRWHISGNILGVARCEAPCQYIK